MDILDLAEVAELLGEPEAVILAACARFPDHVPTLGSGRRGRFPAIALDVLRLITDSMAAGVSHEATLHLIETHFPPGMASPVSDEETETGPPTPVPVAEHDPLVVAGSPVDGDPMTPDLESLIRGAVDAAILPFVQDLVLGLSSMREETLALRGDLGLPAQSDELQRLRDETRAIALAVAEVPVAAGAVSAATAALRGEVADLRRLADGLRTEVASLRAQLDQRDQIGGIAVDLGSMRADMHRLTLATHRSADHARPIVLSPSDGSGTAPRSDLDGASGVGTEHLAGDPDPNAAAAPGDLAAATHETGDDAPAGVITQFASRTPRRMGRSLLADEI